MAKDEGSLTATIKMSKKSNLFNSEDLVVSTYKTLSQLLVWTAVAIKKQFFQNIIFVENVITGKFSLTQEQ